MRVVISLFLGVSFRWFSVRGNVIMVLIISSNVVMLLIVKVSEIRFRWMKLCFLCFL